MPKTGVKSTNISFRIDERASRHRRIEYGPTTPPGDADGEALANLLRATLDDGDRRLRKLGFNITSIRHCAGGKPSASQAIAELANNLLREIYANIARHAAPGSKVDLSVMLRPNAIEITQINPMKEDMAGADERDDELPAATGSPRSRSSSNRIRHAHHVCAGRQLDVVCVHSGDRHRRFARFA